MIPESSVSTDQTIVQFLFSTKIIAQFGKNHPSSHCLPASKAKQRPSTESCCKKRLSADSQALLSGDLESCIFFGQIPAVHPIFPMRSTHQDELVLHKTFQLSVIHFRFVAIECGIPRVSDERMRVTTPGPYRYGDYVRFSCETGYEVYPPRAQALCQNTGTWFYPNAECRRKCAQLFCCFSKTTIFIFVSFVRAQCRFPTSVTQKPEPTARHIGCILCFAAVDCRFPGDPRFGNTIATQGSQLGAELEYRCNDGYRLVGATGAVCMSNGQWSHPKPQCVGQYLSFQPGGD